MEITKNSPELLYFSGYIRNYKALSAELGVEPGLSREEREHEILIKAFEKWGVQLTEHIYGAFAIAIRDSASGKTYLIRDQVGQKHMFYSVNNGELLFSGDINEIVCAEGFEKRLNKDMLQLYLFYGYPIGEETFYDGVYKLMPGHILEYDGKSVSNQQYFMPTFEPDESKTLDDWADEISAVVEEILGEERADEQLPYKESFLSGGVDSSYLLAAGGAACANTVGYEESGFDESALARSTAQALGKDFRVKMIAPEEYFDRIPETIDKIGQPLGDASAVAFSLGCAAVREHAQVVYSGEGIDEFFGGYNAHQREMPKEWTYLTCSHIMSEKYVYELMKDFDIDICAEDIVAPLWKRTEGQPELARRLTVDISLWLEGDIYLNTDRTSTACGIDLHTPFSDLRLFNVARRIPAKYLFMDEQNKVAFRTAAARVLPHDAAFRKKVGFPVPVRDWLADPRFSDRVQEKLFGESSELFFDQDVLYKLWKDFIDGDSALWNKIYAIYVFLVWYDIKFGL